MKSLPPVRSRANERAPPTGPTHPVQDQRSINSGVRPGQQYPAPSCTSDADAIFTVNSTEPAHHHWTIFAIFASCLTGWPSARLEGPITSHISGGDEWGMR